MEEITHLAIIPDGNRRYAKKYKISLEQAYDKSINKVFEITKWCKESNIKTLTIWGFSTENWNRSLTERRILFKLFEIRSKKFMKEFQKNNQNIKINIIGELFKFPKSLQELFLKVQEKSKSNKEFQLNLLLNYGGRKELLSAINQLLKDGIKKINEEDFKKYLWIREEPELIIRTSGETRLSGLLPFQSVYSELFFEKKLFPEFQKDDFLNAIKDFKLREKRFGR